jgi:hypothetical protein
MPSLFQDRRVVLGLLAFVAIGGGLGLAVLVNRGPGPSGPPPASQLGLVVESMGDPGSAGLQMDQPLGCFVDGKYIGKQTLPACAKLNGVATEALNLGVSASGGMAATARPAPEVIPLPPVEVAQAATVVPEVAGTNKAVLTDCWQHEANQWKQLEGQASQEACVRLLYSGHCVGPGSAAYGRYGDSTLRLVPGKVEVSSDNRNFHTIANVDKACQLEFPD